MRVKVIKAGLKSYWYADKIGETFEVESNDNQAGWSYKVINKEPGCSKYFDKDDVEIINEEKVMKKADLRTGMRVMYDNGGVAIVLKDVGVFATAAGYNSMASFAEDLELVDQLTPDAAGWTIQAVYEGYTRNANVLNTNDLGRKLWTRPPKQTQEQKQLDIVLTQIQELQSQAEKLQELINK